MGVWLGVTIYQCPNRPVHILALTTCSGHLAAGADTIKGILFIFSCIREGPLNYLMCFQFKCCKRAHWNSGRETKIFVEIPDCGAPALQMWTWCMHGITGCIPTGCLHPWMWSSAENENYRLGKEGQSDMLIRVSNIHRGGH